MIYPKKIVIFGAGKIGRSFIGQLFSRGGYEVVFIDVFKPVIDELNLKKQYKVIIKSEKEETFLITNVRGVLAGDEYTVIEEVSSAGIVAVSIGQKGLSAALPMIAKGLLKRQTNSPDSALDIIIAENLRNAADFFRNELKEFLNDDYQLDKLVGLVETSIGKMVPIMTRKDMEEDILQVFAEPYNTLILDKKGFRNPIPEIEGLSPKENMKAWVDRKLFIHNLGHAATAYLAYQYNPEFVYLFEALAIPEVHQKVRETMLQAAVLLLKKYPDEFTMQHLVDHTDDLLKRFQNKALGDTIFRVGCDLQRKLGADDRLAGAIHLALELDLPYDKILESLVAGCHFRAVDENGNQLPDDLKFNEIYDSEIEKVVVQICGFSEKQHSQLLNEAKKHEKINT
jgi:mannitol-1-phosphate 5-dehydrogenase